MTKHLIIFTLAMVCAKGKSQYDTIFTVKRTHILCRILEISEAEIKYKRAELLEGPTYVIEKSAMIKYTLASGFSETFNKESPSKAAKPLQKEPDNIKPDYSKITSYKGWAIKTPLFGFVFDHIGLSLERVLTKELNLEIDGGYINSSINQSNNLFVNHENVTYTGFYIKPGIKAMFVRDKKTIDKLDFHPLKGGYFRFDLAYSDIKYYDLTKTISNSFGSGGTTTVSSDLHTSAYGVFFNFGYQLVSQSFVFDFSAGPGYTGQTYSYSNPDYLTANTYSFFRTSDIHSFNYYHAFIRAPYIGLSFALTFKVGYIID